MPLQIGMIHFFTTEDAEYHRAYFFCVTPCSLWLINHNI